MGVDPHRKAGLIVRSTRIPTRRTPTACARRRPDVAPVPAHQRRQTEQMRVGRQGRGRRPARAQGRHVHHVGGPVRRAVHDVTGRPTSTLGDDVYVGLVLCSHNGDVVERAIFSDVRIIRPAKEISFRIAITSAACSRFSTSQTGRQVISPSEQPFEAPNWTPDGKRAHLQHQRPHRRRAAGCIVSTWPRASRRTSTPAPDPEQQRPRAVFDGTMLGISDQSIQGRLDDLHGAGRRRHAEADHPLAPPICTAGRRTASGWSSPAAATASSTSTGSPSDGSGAEVNLTELHGLDDGPEYHAGRQVHLFQLRAQRDDADLADAAGRHEPGAGDQRRVQQLVPAHLAGRQVDRHHRLPEGHRPDRPSVLQARYLRLMPIGGGRRR